MTAHGVCCWRRVRLPHLAVLLGSASPVQTGSPLGSSAGDSHSDPAGDHPGLVAIHQDPQAAGPPRAGVRHLRQILAAGNGG